MKINFDTQYNECYKARMRILKELVLKNPAIEEYGLPIEHVDGDLKRECVVVATLFVAGGAKHSILNEGNTPVLSKGKEHGVYLTEDAVTCIEDESGKVQMMFSSGFEKLKAYVSGMVCGFVGKLCDKNVFECWDVIFPVPVDPIDLVRKGRVLLVSNVVISSANIHRLKLISDIFSGRVDEIIVIGDVFASENNGNYDKWIEETMVRITIVPGINDPTTSLLPQEPIPEKFFKNFKKEKLQLVGNPCKIDVLGNKFVIMTHHIVDDIIKYIPVAACVDCQTQGNAEIGDECRMEILEEVVRIRHLAPNSPDTIGCVPYKDEDPFILNEFNFLVTGGFQNSVKKEFYGNILLGVPDFNATKKALLFDFNICDFKEIELSGF